MLRLCIDVSNYSGPISIEQATALYALGVRKAIVQFVNPSILVHRQQIPNLKAAGISVEGYSYCWFSAGPSFIDARTQWACTEAQSFGVTHMWIDCEQSMGDNPPFDHVHQPVSPSIRAAVDRVKAMGLTAGIYTAAWWWIPGASNSQEWKDLPLWNANYDLDPDLDVVNYGGWTVPRMEQYQGDTTLAGVPYIDLNSFEGTPDVPSLPIAQINDLLTQARGKAMEARDRAEESQALILQAYYLLNPGS